MERYISKLGKLYDIDECATCFVVIDHDREMGLTDRPCVACTVYDKEDIEAAVKSYEDEEGYSTDKAFFLVNGIKFFSRDIMEQTGNHCFGDLDISLIADVFEEFTINEGKSFDTESLKHELAECEYNCLMKGYIKEDECQFYHATDIDRLNLKIIDWNYACGADDTDIFTDDWKGYFSCIDDQIYGMTQMIEDLEEYTPEETELIGKGKALLEELKALKG